MFLLGLGRRVGRPSLICGQSRCVPALRLLKHTGMMCSCISAAYLHPRILMRTLADPVRASSPRRPNAVRIPFDCCPKAAAFKGSFCRRNQARNERKRACSSGVHRARLETSRIRRNSFHGEPPYFEPRVVERTEALDRPQNSGTDEGKFSPAPTTVVSLSGTGRVV